MVRMHRGPDLGVMGNPNGAVRDPLFFNWHKVFFYLTSTTYCVFNEINVKYTALSSI